VSLELLTDVWLKITFLWVMMLLNYWQSISNVSKASRAFPTSGPLKMKEILSFETSRIKFLIMQ